MTTDNVNIDELLDDIPEDGQVEQQEQIQEPAPVAEPAAVEPEPTPEEAGEIESQVAKVFDKVDHSGGRVSVEDHIKLRKRAQEAERERDELKANQVTVTPNNVLEELSGLVSGEDDGIVEVGQLKKVVEKLPGAIENVATKAVNKTIAGIGAKNRLDQAAIDEKAIRAEVKDYDTIVDTALNMNLISDAEFEACKQSANMPKAIYDVAQKKVNGLRTTLGVSVPESQIENNNTPTPEPIEEVFADDDEAFEAMVGGS